MTHIKEIQNNKMLLDLIGQRRDIYESFEEPRQILNEFNQRDESFLIEARLAGKLSGRQLKKLFQAVSDISKGRTPRRENPAKELAQKMINSIKGSEEKLRNTDPVENYEPKVVNIINKWKDKLGIRDKAVEAATELGEFGKNHPKTTAFIIGVLALLTTVLSSPGFGAAASVALNTAIDTVRSVR